MDSGEVSGLGNMSTNLMRTPFSDLNLIAGGGLGIGAAKLLNNKDKIKSAL